MVARCQKLALRVVAKYILMAGFPSLEPEFCPFAAWVQLLRNAARDKMTNEWRGGTLARSDLSSSRCPLLRDSDWVCDCSREAESIRWVVRLSCFIFS